jgi:glycosyltransferase involved in cell wall biosynthesis
MSEQKIDVVVPIYNGEKFIAASINSLISQVGIGQVVAVNDGSTDNSLELLEDLARQNHKIKIISTPNNGLSAARNIGWKHCNSDYVGFLDVDDLYLEGKILRHIEHLSSHASCTLSFSHAVQFSQTLDDSRPQPINNEPINFENLLLGLARIEGSGSSAVVRKTALEQSGGFDESLKFGEDWDLWLKLARMSDPCLIDKTLTGIRLNPTGMQNSQHKGIKNFRNSFISFYEWEKYPYIFENPEFPESARRAIWTEMKRNFNQPYFLYTSYPKKVATEFPVAYKNLIRIFGRNFLFRVILLTLFKRILR